jgi:hypothetical protein
VLTSKGVNFHAAEKTSGDAKKDESANWKSCTRLSLTGTNIFLYYFLNIILIIF